MAGVAGGHWPATGWAMSPMSNPFQPSLATSVENFSMYRISSGCPPFRLRDRRMTCQCGP